MIPVKSEIPEHVFTDLESQHFPSVFAKVELFNTIEQFGGLVETTEDIYVVLVYNRGEVASREIQVGTGSPLLGAEVVLFTCVQNGDSVVSVVSPANHEQPTPGEHDLGKETPINKTAHFGVFAGPDIILKSLGSDMIEKMIHSPRKH